MLTRPADIDDTIGNFSEATLLKRPGKEALAWEEPMALIMPYELEKWSCHLTACLAVIAHGHD